MWERSGGNKGMVDQLVCDWNAANADKPINLSYIPHAEMVGKIAQGIASGDVPDLMGMDLIYAPQFENAGQLVDLTDKIGDWPELDTASPGHMTVATFNDRLYGVPLYADVSALFYNKDLFEQAGLDPNKPPTSLAELREYADKITALGGDIKGYYLPGNCAGCNIFTVGPLMWASDAVIEAATCGDEPLDRPRRQASPPVGARAGQGRQRSRGRPAETGETFHLQFGSGKLGMMGTGNFNITLANEQMAGHEFEYGITNLPGVEPGSSASFIGGDLVVVPNGSDRVDDAVEFMKFILSDNEQVEGYAKLLNLTTRSDMADNKYFEAEPLVQDVAKALDVGRTPYTLTFFEQINSPQGPWLQMLQRAYYTDDDIDTIINETKEAMKQISCQPVTVPHLRAPRPRCFAEAPRPRSPRPAGVPAQRPPTDHDRIPRVGRRRQPSRESGMYATRRYKLIGLLYLAPAILFVLVFTAYPFIQMVWLSFNSWSLITPPKFIGIDNFTRAFSDRQFWVSLTLQPPVHAPDHADPDGRRLPAWRCCCRGNSRAPARDPDGRVRARWSSASACRACSGTGCSTRPSVSINTALIDLGLIDKPIIWLGTDAWLSTVGDHRLDLLEGHRLRDAPVRGGDPGHPVRDRRGDDGRWRELPPADPACDPAADPADDPARDADQRHRVAAGLRPVLHHDRRPAVQRDGDRGLLRLPQLVPVPEARVRGGAVADPRRDHPGVHGRPAHPDPPEPCLT